MLPEFKPVDAAALVILDHERKRVLLAQRNPEIKFLGGFHAFPGGKADHNDWQIGTRNGSNELSRHLVCAVRETFEETGLLLVRGGEKLTKGQRASLHDDLVSGRSLFREILDDWGLWIDFDDFEYAGYWTTPKFSELRFKTHFFLTVCPSRQTPYEAMEELQDCKFVLPAEALGRWRSSEILMSPPVLISMMTTEAVMEEGVKADEKLIAQHLRSESEKVSGEIPSVEINPHTLIIPLQTVTLPPATHTNCFIVGRKRFVVIDAASRFAEEQRKLSTIVDSLLDDGGECLAIITSHLHPDHFGGESSLKQHIEQRTGRHVPLLAHSATAESLAGKVSFDSFVEDGDELGLQDSDGAAFTLRILHTPGHAKGHLCFYDQSKGFLISCDNVINTGTVVIAPPEGDMAEYLKSLERMKALDGLKSLCGSHGTAVYDAVRKIDGYIDHRLKREEQINSLLLEEKSPEEIFLSIYPNLPDNLHHLARKTIEAHILKINQEGRV